jgi:hypothetical protein
MTVGELEDRMGARELSRWMLYESEEPFLPARVDLAAGLISSTMANIHRGKTTPAFVPLDFMPLAAKAIEAARVEAHRIATLPSPEDEDDAMVQRMVAAFGGGMDG